MSVVLRFRGGEEPSSHAVQPEEGLRHFDEASLFREDVGKRDCQRVLIAGAGTVGRTLAAQLEADARYQVIGFVDDEIDPFGNKDWPILGPRAAAVDIIRKYQVDEVVVAYAPTWQQELVDDLLLDDLSVNVRVVPSHYETMLCSPRIESVGDVALFSVVAATEQRATDIAKRVFDFTVAAVGLIVLAPVMATVAAAIAITSPGPILFRQERVGYRGKTFTLLKFRTMRTDAESRTGPVLSAGKADSRLTPMGRVLRLFRLDELPQLLNVLRGEMSLVGPRPERPHFVKQFITRNPIYAKRHNVRPGITGIAQIHGGYHTDARDKLRFDLFYVARHSLWMDLSILVQTVRDMIFRPDGC
jgi:exopolysaccharide biosynthesis polyprenyl glycosylphosphotransferase